MKEMMVIVVIALLGLIGCTDALKANIKSIGKEHTIKMYNGGVLVESYISTGKVVSISDSDGWQFMDKETKQLVRVSGDCIIEVN